MTRFCSFFNVYKSIEIGFFFITNNFRIRIPVLRFPEEATKYRELADMAKDAVTKQALLELAAACEGIADKMDDLRSSG